MYGVSLPTVTNKLIKRINNHMLPPPPHSPQGHGPARRPTLRPRSGTGEPAHHAPRTGGTRPRFGSSARSSHPPRRGKTRVEHQPDSRNRRADAPIQQPAEDTVRIIPLSGVEEVGRNMTAIEFGGDIFIVDCGFAFSEVETPGIDYILPNTGYLEERRDKIRGLLITHGHL